MFKFLVMITCLVLIKQTSKTRFHPFYPSSFLFNTLKWSFCLENSISSVQILKTVASVLSASFGSSCLRDSILGVYYPAPSVVHLYYPAPGVVHVHYPAPGVVHLYYFPISAAPWQRACWAHSATGKFTSTTRTPLLGGTVFLQVNIGIWKQSSRFLR